MTLISKNPWEESVKICSASYIICCCWTVPLRGGNEFGARPLTRFWYLLGVFSKFSDQHPHHFHRGVPAPPPPQPNWPQSCKNLTSPFHFFQVIKRANGVQYGLCAVVWTENVSRTHRVSQQLQVSSGAHGYGLLVSLHNLWSYDPHCVAC